VVDIQKIVKTTPKKHSGRKKWQMILVVVIIIVIIAAGTVWWFVFGKNINKNINKNNTTSSEVSSDQKVQLNIDKANNLYQQGKTDEAVSLYKQAVSETSSKEQKNFVYLSLATSYFNSGDYNNALSNALVSEKYQRDSNTEQFIASIYEKMGDKQNAIKYYQNAITLINSTDSDGSNGDSTTYYNYKIKELSE
jgi:tetratricopeptide (TPR) repeat protein